LLTSLPAIGGERTSGYGSFTLSQVDAGQLPRLVGAGDASLAARFMSLTTALPSDAELDAALAGATYRLVRRSGFVASATYADTPLRKRDIYKLAAGSMFTSRFTGLVADVSNEGAHPVWSYAKPLFLPIQELS
jgi:CRISPR-associated protein Csm4